MQVQNFSDQQLISAFLSGDSLSIEYLIIRYKDKVFRFIISKVKDVFDSMTVIPEISLV